VLRRQACGHLHYDSTEKKKIKKNGLASVILGEPV
jgi:hypothetical protein